MVWGKFDVAHLKQRLHEIELALKHYTWYRASPSIESREAEQRNADFHAGFAQAASAPAVVQTPFPPSPGVSPPGAIRDPRRLRPREKPRGTLMST